MSYLPDIQESKLLPGRIEVGSAVILKEAIIGFYPFEHEGRYDTETNTFIDLSQSGYGMTLDGRWWQFPKGRYVPACYTILVLQGGVKLYLPEHVLSVREWFLRVEADDADYEPMPRDLYLTAQVLRAWADRPAESGYVPVHPDTLRRIADRLGPQGAP